MTSADGGQSGCGRVVATAIERFDKLLLWTGPTLANRQNLVIRLSREEG